MSHLTKSPMAFRPPPAYQPAFQSITSDIDAAVQIIDQITERLGSLRAGLMAIQTKAMSTSGTCVPLTDERGPNWITRREAAVIAGVHPSCLNIWVRTGVIPANALLLIGKKRFRYSRAWFEMRRADQLAKV